MLCPDISATATTMIKTNIFQIFVATFLLKRSVTFIRIY